jgi:hypothetical protein
MTSCPELSIVTISYQDPEGLRATNQSLSALLHSPLKWEHVVVDQSPALYSSIISELPAKWPLAHIVAEPAGIYPAMNRGLGAARGKYVWFLNGGDCLADANTLTRAIEFLNTEAAPDIVCCSSWMSRGGQRLHFKRTPHATFFESIMGTCALIHQGMIYRRSVFDKVGHFDESYRIIGDYQHHFRCHYSGVASYCCDDVLCDYDLGGVSTTNLRSWRLELKALNQWLTAHMDAELLRTHKRACARNVTRRYATYLAGMAPTISMPLRKILRKLAPDPLLTPTGQWLPHRSDGGLGNLTQEDLGGSQKPAQSTTVGS